MPQQPSADVQEFLDAHPVSGFQWLVFVLCFCVVLLDGFDTAAISYIAPRLVAEWGIERPALGPVLSAALFGLAFGALAAGPLADRFGRKRVLVGSVLLIGATSLASSFAGSLGALTAWRFATGLGLGAAMPNAVTLMSEYCPAARRATLTNAMFCGFPLGAAFGGFLAAWMIPAFGWRSVLLLGGVVPLALGLLLVLRLPESVRYMVAKRHAPERIRAVLRRIGPEAAEAADFTLAEATPAQRGGIRLVLSRPYALGSAMLWLTYFMGLVIFYALLNWMPILFGDAGLDPRTAALIAALFPLGGFGAILCGWLMDRMNPNLVIAAGFALTSLAVWAIGQAAGNLSLLMAAVFVAGTLMNTAQSSLPALAAGFYPTQGRATGVAWMLGLGRFGGIAGSFLVAELARRQMGFGAIFTVMAIPGLVAAAALLVKQAARPGEAAPRAEAVLGH
ncbi:MFS transporter [Paracraurococcus lichenis]|uniref:MFS transporter n=1 Tax=Paracraurococcus lichenis TaxID=3064888 RepID=A0ABT9DW06_9PROT|nr:MFS transporter [Paracraurococcus sp. LOR1-02]MDO9708086.1 MFS transporter [Paracraurococcus sp. LOR1-02]